MAYAFQTHVKHTDPLQASVHTANAYKWAATLDVDVPIGDVLFGACIDNVLGVQGLSGLLNIGGLHMVQDRIMKYTGTPNTHMHTLIGLPAFHDTKHPDTTQETQLVELSSGFWEARHSFTVDSE